MQISIPKSAIGDFTSVEQKRTYDRMARIMEPTRELADTFVKLDNAPADAHSLRTGSVLLDGHHQGKQTLTGTCRFEPTSGQVTRFDAELVRDEEVPHSGCEPYEVIHERFQIERADDGSVTYLNGLGMVRETTDGTLFLDTEGGLVNKVTDSW